MTKTFSIKKRRSYVIIKIEEYELLDIDSGPYGITTGNDGALWFTQIKPIKLDE